MRGRALPSTCRLKVKMQHRNVSYTQCRFTVNSVCMRGKSNDVGVEMRRAQDRRVRWLSRSVTGTRTVRLTPIPYALCNDPLPAKVVRQCYIVLRSS